MIQTVIGLAAIVLADPQVCIPDREALLSLDQQAFDQDIDGGWRAISYKEGCELEAALLIADYRDRHGLEGETILWWHEGQVLAGIDLYEEAILRFRNSYKPDDQDFIFDTAWNFYVDATIAFLQRDRDALAAARDGLYALPKPDGFDDQSDEIEEKFGFRPVWPQNGPVVESLIRCFDKPYSEAYSRDCGLEE